MLVDFECTCGEAYSIPETLIGRQIRCPFCFALNSVVETGPDGEPLANDAGADDPSPRPRSRWLAYAALSLLMPLGGVAGLKAMGGRHEGEGGAFVRNPATTRENGLPIKAVALAAAEESEPVPEPRQAVAQPVQRAAPQPSGPLDSFLGRCDPIFVDPKAEDRLRILHKMICEYNDADELQFGRRGMLVGSREDTRYRDHQARIPTADELKAWFKGLTHRQKVAIAWEFNDRSRYLSVVRESIAKERETGKMNWDGPSGGHDVAMFGDPMDVFVSPNDGLPFLIGRTKIHFPWDGYAHDSNVIVREQRGVESLDPRFLDYRRDIQCIGLDGEVDFFHEKIGEGEATTRGRAPVAP